jgi:SAM-dependent methyltransferase
MPANFTRRRDLFLDAGFPDPDAALATLTDEVKGLGLPAEWGTGMPVAGVQAIRAALAERVGQLPPDQQRLARLVPEWIGNRSGDLATALWLARAEHGDTLDLPGYLLTILDALLADKRDRDALAYARFMLDLRFDWGRVYSDPNLAYAFLHEREPNPLVWRLLDDLAARDVRLRVLELGCGVGNDALGMLASPLVDSYVGVDVSKDALDVFRRRAAAAKLRVAPQLVQGDFHDVLERPPGGAAQPNLIYSYSSLHYFSSGELARIYDLVRSTLLETRGFFAFGIKGAGSIWEGQGLALYRPDVWVNWDGQSRWFPSKRALGQQLDKAGFETRFHELHDHWGYSETGKLDVFHYVLCSPRGSVTLFGSQ